MQTRRLDQPIAPPELPRAFPELDALRRASSSYIPTGGAMTTRHVSTDTYRPPIDTLKEQLRRVGVTTFTAPSYRCGNVGHIVLIRFSDEVPASARTAAIQAFLALRSACVREDKPYIRSIEAGAQSSGEGADRGFEHAFVLHFDSEGDRNYYVGEPVVDDADFYDPRHHAFKQMIGPLLAPQGVLVFDYTDGVGITDSRLD
jgi:hypothetical protein